MKRFLTLTLVVALLSSYGPERLFGAQGVNGTMGGIVSSPSGPLAGLTVNVVNSSGTIVGTTTTSSAGAYSVGGLPAGTYTVQVVDQAGRVLATSTGSVTANATTATVNLALTASQLAGAANAAGGATLLGLSAVKVLAVAAAAGAGIYVVTTLDDSSPTR